MAYIFFCTFKNSKLCRVWRKIIFGLILGVILGNIVLKHMFSRLRPFQINTSKNLLIKAPTDFSFPSVHTLSSVISAYILIHTNIAIGTFAVIACIFIVFSRMYLYVHYPSDILGGIILGIIIANVVLKTAI